MASRGRGRSRDPAGFARQEDRSQGATNAFKNDGSFLEMFMKSQRTGIPVPGTSFKKEASADSAAGTPQAQSGEQSNTEEKKNNDVPKPKYGFVGKRRGGKILPTGKVKKAKQEDEEDEETGKKDAWSQYLSEVKKYKNQSCQEEGATRPLVK